jgi:putative DNA methylase
MKKKLIEVALPLEAINKEAAREKSIRHGHPSTLHLWWARRPLAACRAVLFASLVDDPSSHPEEFPTEADQDRERQRLFRLLEELVKWENSNNRAILDAAHKEILKSTGGNPPPVYDPFCGGGSIPLEAQRLGLEAHGSDLNPVAVLITKALIEIPPKFAGQPPVNPAARKKMSAPGLWAGARGLADDIRYYGQWMRDRAWERIGHLYPKVKLPKEQGGGEATVIAWLWARTVECPNPACGSRMPLVRSFSLSTKTGKRACIIPVLDHAARTVRYRVTTGESDSPEGTVNRRGARCLLCGVSVPFDYIRAEGKAGRLRERMTAVVAEGQRGRIYVAPSTTDEDLAASATPEKIPDSEMPEQALGFRIQPYGLARHSDLFTRRQLVALTTFSDLVNEAREQLTKDGASSEYANAVALYLGMGVSKSADYWSNLCIWRSDPKNLGVGHVFARQALQMIWDFAEANPFSESSGNWLNNIGWTPSVLELVPASVSAAVLQLDATALTSEKSKVLVSTDPPYYDNIGYADLSDFFYVWLRRSLAPVLPDLFSTLLVPKKQELIASPERFDGSRVDAQKFFEDGSRRAFERIRDLQDPGTPLSVFYAFKQAEEDGDEEVAASVASTGWETMLEGLLRAGLQVTGTWPARSEMSNRTRGQGSNALASSIILVCRRLSESAAITTRKDFLSSLKRELPNALRDLQKGNIAPVDLAQAAIGPGMAVFSRYKKVLESDGSPMRVRTALSLINQTLDEVLSEQESDFDRDTRWALAWFEQNQFGDGLYGQAEVLATAKAVAISGLMEAGLVHSRAGKVRLLRREEMPDDWDPATDRRLTIWEVTQHLIRCLDKKGEADAAALKARIGGLAETARELAYRLYTLCERKGWAEEAGYYNSLVIAWPSISRVPELFQ